MSFAMSLGPTDHEFHETHERESFVSFVEFAAHREAA